MVISHEDERHHKFPEGWKPLYDEPLYLLEDGMNVWMLVEDVA